MKKLLYFLIPAALIGIMVIQLKANKDLAENRVYHYDKQQPINVHTTTLDLKDTDAAYSFTGTFEADRETRVNAEVPGKIKSMYVDAGSLVKKGQALVKLDDALLQLQLQSVDVQIEVLEADVKRYSILADADAIQGVKLEKVEFGLRSAKIQRATLLEKIRKTTVRAPFNGVVTRKISEVGGYAAPGVPLIQLTDISKLRFSTNIPERDLVLFQINQTYPISADVYPELELSGKTILIGSKGNMGKSFPVQFALNNTSDLKIKAGMFGELNLSHQKSEKQIVIPASSIVGSNLKPQVYLVKDGQAHLQDITISKRIQNTAVIQSGLQKGDVIVTGGFINLFDGANVAIN